MEACFRLPDVVHSTRITCSCKLQAQPPQPANPFHMPEFSQNIYNQHAPPTTFSRPAPQPVLSSALADADDHFHVNLLTRYWHVPELSPCTTLQASRQWTAACLLTRRVKQHVCDWLAASLRLCHIPPERSWSCADCTINCSAVDYSVEDSGVSLFRDQVQCIPCPMKLLGEFWRMFLYLHILTWVAFCRLHHRWNRWSMNLDFCWIQNRTGSLLFHSSSSSSSNLVA